MGGRRAITGRECQKRTRERTGAPGRGAWLTPLNLYGVVLCFGSLEGSGIPEMPRWNNAPLLLYHGTDSQALAGAALTKGAALATFAADLMRCRPNTDFGRGFYMTTSERQARNWANLRVHRFASGRAHSAMAPRAVVLSFNLDRDWLASLDTLCFVLPNRDFFDLVWDCRMGQPPHQRGSSKVSYDVVYGPVTLWPQGMVVGDADQVSFHTDGVVSSLPKPIVFDVASLPTGLFDRVTP